MLSGTHTYHSVNSLLTTLEKTTYDSYVIPMHLNVIFYKIQKLFSYLRLITYETTPEQTHFYEKLNIFTENIL